MNFEIEAVLGVEMACLHDVPHQRIEHRQREAGDLDDREVLRLRGQCEARDANGRGGGDYGKDAT